MFPCVTCSKQVHFRILEQQRRGQIGQQVHDDYPSSGGPSASAASMNCSLRSTMCRAACGARRIDGAECDDHFGQRRAKGRPSSTFANRMSGNAISASVMRTNSPSARRI